MVPALLRADGTGISLASLDIQWSRADGWHFTAIAECGAHGSFSALAVFGVSRHVKIDKVHVTESRTFFAGHIEEEPGAFRQRKPGRRPST
jgi:hypothetical protein